MFPCPTSFLAKTGSSRFYACDWVVVSDQRSFEACEFVLYLNTTKISLTELNNHFTTIENNQSNENNTKDEENESIRMNLQIEIIKY